MNENAQHATVFDSDRQYLGGIYAKALLGATEKHRSTDEVLEQFGSLITDILDRLPKFEAVLGSPRVSHEETVQILDKAFASRMHKDLLNFLKVVSRHGRLNCLRVIYAEMLKQYNVLRGRVEVDVETATPLPDALRAELVSRLKQSLRADVVLRTKVNPELVGGLVIRVGDTVYDGSVANQMSRFEDAVMNRTRRELREQLDRFALAD